MDKNKKELAKQRSFVCKLTKSQIVNLLKECGLVLNTTVYSEFDGKHLPAIERGYNKETDEWELFIRCKVIDKQLNNVYNFVKSKMPAKLQTYYSPMESVVNITDFSFCELSITQDEERAIKLQSTFARFMYKQFGEYYKTKYNSYVKKVIKEENCK